MQSGLEKKGFLPFEIQEVVLHLEREHLLDDAIFAQDWAFSRVPNKLWGRERVRHELLNKGICMEHIAEAIQQVYTEYPEEDLAFRAARKRWNSTLAKDSLRARQKVGSYLQRQGFPFDTIIKALDRLKD